MVKEQINGTFVLILQVAKTIALKEGHAISREDFLGQHISPSSGCLGVFEGELLSEQAHERGYETESWVLDSGLAPHARDWLASEDFIQVSAYFSTEAQAVDMRDELLKIMKPEAFDQLQVKITFEPDQDWNAEWKKSFQGIQVTDDFQVLPPWHDAWKPGMSGVLCINPGAGFGTGTHETTQLCLQVLRRMGDLSGKTVLDFGSGSGILGLAAALWGAKSYCVEIDPLANDNARDNAGTNQLENQVHFFQELGALPEKLRVNILVANILRPILLEFKFELIARLMPESDLVLSGLIESDLPAVIEAYRGSFHRHEVFSKGEWRAIHLKRKA